MEQITKNRLLTTTIIFLSLLLLSIPKTFAQENTEHYLLDADSTWGHEIFHFPIGFAQELPYTGVEDACFPRNWNQPDSAAFWSYVFAWNIALDSALTASELEMNLQTYFDGLMSQRKGNSTFETVALLLEFSQEEGAQLFLGKVAIFEGFYTKQPMILYAAVEQSNCDIDGKRLLLFRFSPKPTDHPIWERLNSIEPLKSCP